MRAKLHLITVCPIWGYLISYIALRMHLGLATHQKVPKWAILTLMDRSYPFECSCVG